jgi:glutamate racemase
LNIPRDELSARIAAGIAAGARDAVEKARATKTKLVIQWEGQIRHVTAEEWDILSQSAKIHNNLPIGIFDSGVGGLTVLRALQTALPNESFLYLGDTARLPYGTKSAPTIIKYASQAAALLHRRGIKALMIACNTASAHALPSLCAQFPGLPVFGVIEPGAAAACAATKNNHVAVISTESTARAGVYPAAIKALRPEIAVTAIAGTLLVALAEEGWTTGNIPEEIIRHYLAGIFQGPDRPDTLILGCTHFPILADSFRAVLPAGVTLIDSGIATAPYVARAIEPAMTGTPPATRFSITDGIERFARCAGRFLQQDVPSEMIELVEFGA